MHSICVQPRRTLLGADVDKPQYAYGVETYGNQTNRPKGEAIPAGTFGTRRTRTHRARSQPWPEGSPSRQGKGSQAVQHGREIAPRPTPIIVSRGFQQLTA